MPVSDLGQLITFSIEIDADQRYSSYIWVTVVKGDTIAKIAARRGNPEDARDIADINGIRSIYETLQVKRVRVPGTLRQADSFHVLAGDEPPSITDGYGKYDTVDRLQRVGLTVFQGFNPIAMEVPIRFDAYRSRDGSQIEKDIFLLERMGGRGNFSGSAVGPPPVIRVSTTNSAGAIVPLIPSNYQWSSQNKSAPMWRVAGIDWTDGAIRDNGGNRILQEATVHLQQHVRVNVVTRSATERAKAKKKKKKKKK